MLVIVVKRLKESTTLVMLSPVTMNDTKVNARRMVKGWSSQ